MAHVRTVHGAPPGGAAPPAAAAAAAAGGGPGGLQVWFQFDTLQGPVGPHDVDPAGRAVVCLG